MKKLSKFNAQFITDTYFKGWEDPSVINTGNCFQWAYLAFKTFQYVELWDVSCHAFIRYRGKFYDAERPEGEKDWRDLPACNFGRGLLWCGRKQSLTNFKKTWNRSCYVRFLREWHELDEWADKILSKHKRK